MNKELKQASGVKYSECRVHNTKFKINTGSV